jgi:hypothetical protein
MHDYSLTHLRDDALLRDLAMLVAQDHVITATLLAHIAEVDTRRLYVPAGYSSMHAYCVEELRLSEDAAGRRIQAARAGRRYPSLFTALAEGRLHLTAVCLLAPHLTAESAEELITAATHKKKSEIEVFLAGRFGRPELPASMRPITAIRPLDPHEFLQHALAHAENSREKPAPAWTERFLLKVAIPKSKALLSHAIPSGDIAQVLARALKAAIPLLERQKFGAITRRPHPERTFASVQKRHIPAQVRRAVWKRDQGQCTFVSASGTRCKARRFLEFDHMDPVARGGEATVERMRLRCRAHNQL